MKVYIVTTDYATNSEVYGVYLFEDEAIVTVRILHSQGRGAYEDVSYSYKEWKVQE